MRPARSATHRCAIAARSAARSPTPTRRRDLPATALALGATLVAQGPNGDARDRRGRLLHRLPRRLAGRRRAAHRDPRAEDGRRRLELPEVQPAGPGLGHRRRRRLAAQRRQRGRPWSTWARRRSSRPASRAALAAGASIADAAAAGRRRGRAAERPQRQPGVPHAPRQGARPPRPGGRWRGVDAPPDGTTPGGESRHERVVNGG